MDLENLKKLSREAAQSDFLWELGMRVPSANQARNICRILSVDLADERRVKAVMRLRELDPQALLEIRDAAADEGEEAMPETIVGPWRLARKASTEDKKLWDKIFQDLGIVPFEDVDAQVRELPVVFNATLDERERQTDREQKKLPRVVSMYDYYSSRPHFITGLRIRKEYSCPSTAFALLTDHGIASDAAVVRVFASLVCQPYNIWSDEAKALPHFYIDGRLAPLHVETGLIHSSTINDVRWADAVVSVRDKKFQMFAQNLARAYEAETARRRKPAKAVVLKNY